MPKTLQEREPGVCMFPDCKDLGTYARGNCIYHYGLLRAAVFRGRKKWQDFEKYGYCRPATYTHRPDDLKHFKDILNKMV